MKALVVTSGGMDSTTAVYHAYQAHDGDIGCVSFNYNQKHSIELDRATLISHRLQVPHAIVPLPQWSTGSALTSDAAVPEGHYADETMKQTVVPNRNSIMLNVAAGMAMNEGADLVYAGMHAGDHPIYPDCRPEFVDALNELLGVANAGHNPPVVIAPFIRWEKADIAQYGDELGVPFELTWSCYKGGVPNKDILVPGTTAKMIHCGRCSTCVERQEAFYVGDVHDLTEYEDSTYWRAVIDG